MLATVRCNEKATFERRVEGADLEYGTALEVWEVVAARYWVEAQDVLPSRGESTQNGLKSNTLRTRLRMRNSAVIRADMRVTLHGKGDRVMQIVSGPAMLDDRMHMEFMLEAVGDV